MRQRTARVSGPPVKRDRRSLGQVGGAVELRGGNPAERELIRSALDVQGDEASTMVHIHGFHAYAARLHPVTAGKLLRGAVTRSVTVLDPFCGSGTVLVEARLCGHRGIGVDSNPLAVELACLKTRGTDARFESDLAAAAHAVAAHAEDRRTKKQGPTRRYGRIYRDRF